MRFGISYQRGDVGGGKKSIGEDFRRGESVRWGQVRLVDDVVWYGLRI